MAFAGEPDKIDDLLRQCSLEERGRSTRCCCGSLQCPYLAHNNATLAGLEKDLLSAAQIGQALLVRHENHMAEAEAERVRMTAGVEKLEADKKELELANTKSIEENRHLLGQLESLNNLVSDSDLEIQSLTAALQSTRQELQKLAVLAGRAASLETQLTNMELEQAQLQEQLFSNEELNRSSMQRWKRAEGTIEHLQEQTNKIEREAREERERHVEVLNRMERRRAIEKELGNIASRQPGSASANYSEANKNGNSVVSHFVKDILQDNANLQMGVVELREMLMESNAEVENMREQLQIHQPLEDQEYSQVSLQKELLGEKTSNESQEQRTDLRPEFHVHHHYHGPELIIRRTKKKRPSIISAQTLSSSGSSTPRAQRIRDWRAATSTSAATIISQGPKDIPPASHQQRWSTQSTQTITSRTPSSIPSSPRRSSSIFDNVDSTLESSRPTTPDSSAPGSPKEIWTEQEHDKVAPCRIKLPSASHVNYSTIRKEENPPVPGKGEEIGPFEQSSPPAFLASASRLCLPCPSDIMLSPVSQHTIPEEVECELPEPSTTNSYLNLQDVFNRPLLRRSTSHESLLSVSGMDIHTLRARPSQMLRGQAFVKFSTSHASLSYTKPITSPTAATGVPMFGGRVQDSGEYTRSLLASPRSSSERKTTFGKLMGDWVWSKWGVTQMTPPDNMQSKMVQTPLDSVLRSPGVNQKGQIWGLQPPKPAPINIRPGDIDTNLLQESLADV